MAERDDGVRLPTWEEEDAGGEEEDAPSPNEATTDKRENFAMVPASIIERMPCDACVRLFAFLDLVQGARGRPAKGFRKIGEGLGWQTRTVSKHVQHLRELGLVEVTGGRPARTSHVVKVVHNPARLRSAAGVELPEERRQPARRPSQFGPPADADGKEGQDPAEPVARDARHPEPEPVARDARHPVKDPAEPVARDARHPVVHDARHVGVHDARHVLDLAFEGSGVTGAASSGGDPAQAQQPQVVARGGDDPCGECGEGPARNWSTGGRFCRECEPVEGGPLRPPANAPPTNGECSFCGRRTSLVAEGRCGPCAAGLARADRSAAAAGVGS